MSVEFEKQERARKLFFSIIKELNVLFFPDSPISVIDFLKRTGLDKRTCLRLAESTVKLEENEIQEIKKYVLRFIYTKMEKINICLEGLEEVTIKDRPLTTDERTIVESLKKYGTTDLYGVVTLTNIEKSVVISSLSKLIEYKIVKYNEEEQEYSVS